ncbi:MAG: Fic family protein [Cytophagales bacterium]|nr:Fic family protein [Cytophagales bacterium]
MKYNPGKPYNMLPALPPKTELETKAILKAAIAANRALAKLDGSITQLPNPAVLVDTIGLQEAKASSEIENIITTHDELYQSAVADRRVENPATKEVLFYKEALWHAYEQVKKKGLITTNLCVKTVQLLKQNQAGIRAVPGTQIRNDHTGEIVYTPPEGETIIRNKLHDLEQFINIPDDGLDPLIKMALIHYQFEAIHPFADGNGRTGRILNIIYLVQQEFLSMPVIYLSRYVIDHKAEYYKRLREVTEKEAWQEWVLYMIKAVEATSTHTLSKIESISETMTAIGKTIEKKLPKIYSKDLVEVLFHRPYCKRQFLEDAGIAKLKTAGSYLSELEKIGILQSTQVGKEKLYLNHQLLAILKK